MVNANKLVEIISNYLSNDDAEKFALDFAAASYNIHKIGDPEAIALVEKVESRLADLHCECITQNAFKKFLFEVVAESKPGQVLTVSYSGATVMAPGAGDTSNPPQVGQLRPVPFDSMLPVVLRQLVGQH